MEIQSDLYSCWRFYSLIFFPLEPLDYIIISTRQILLIKFKENFLGPSLKSHREGSQGRKWFAKNTLNTEADLIHVWSCWSAGIGWNLLVLIPSLVFLFTTLFNKPFLIIPGKHVGILYETGSSLSIRNLCHWLAHIWNREGIKRKDLYPLPTVRGRDLPSFIQRGRGRARTALSLQCLSPKLPP